MKIPETVKIGGKTYSVEKTDKLNLGINHYTAEIDYIQLAIRLTPAAEQKMQADFLHELMHGIYHHLGYVDHDEKQIDEMANALYMVIQDNPRMFESK